MKTLIAIVNARHRKEWRQAIRDTWKPLVDSNKADVFFFVGRGDVVVAPQETDVVVLDCDDTYMGLPDKIRAIAAWAWEHQYAFMFKCDDDVILTPEWFLASGYDEYDYTGRANRPPNTDVPFWVPMGFNYIVARKGLPAIFNSPLPENSNDDEKWVAGCLHNVGIELHDDLRYRLHYGITTQQRPLRPIHRPLKPPSSLNEEYPGTFARCIFIEGHSGNMIPLTYKIAEFHKVFALSRKEVQNKNNQ